MAAEGKKVKQMSSEKYFLMYAYPCSFVLVELGRITEEKRKELEKKLLRDQPIDRKELEHLFPAAFKRIKQLAIQMRKDTWDMVVIKEYFFGEKHNDFINKGDGMYSVFGPSFKELCKVHKAEVLARKGNILTIRYGGGRSSIVRKVFAKLAPDAKKGDTVTVHLAFAIEKIN